jgi:hypothetical protein
MGTIRKIIGSELIGTLGQEEIYPVTHAKAVYGYVNSAHSITADKSLYSILDDIYSGAGGDSTIKSIALDGNSQAISSAGLVDIKSIYFLPSFIATATDGSSFSSDDILAAYDPNSDTGSKYTLKTFLQLFDIPNCLYKYVLNSSANSEISYFNAIGKTTQSGNVSTFELADFKSNTYLTLTFNITSSGGIVSSIVVSITKKSLSITDTPIKTISFNNEALEIDSNKNVNIKSVYKLPSFIVDAADGSSFDSTTITGALDPNSSTGANYTLETFLQLFEIPDCIYKYIIGSSTGSSIEYFTTISYTSKFSKISTICLADFKNNILLTLTFNITSGETVSSITVNVSRKNLFIPDIPIKTISLDSTQLNIDSNKNIDIKLVYKMPSFILDAASGTSISESIINTEDDPNADSGTKYTFASLKSLFLKDDCVFNNIVTKDKSSIVSRYYNLGHNSNSTQGATSFYIADFKRDQLVIVSFYSEYDIDDGTTYKYITIYKSTLYAIEQSWIEA